MRFGLLLSVLSTAVCAAQTPVVCPWLATGSASSVLGGPVELSAHIESNFQGTCRFVRASTGEQQSLEIVVGKADTHACPQGSAKLIALGNEAVQCRSTNAQGQPLDRIAGRLRDVYFVVSIGNVSDAATIPSEPKHLPDPYRASLLERLAEQVIGNLY